jgi:hypothetical protein
MPCANPAKRVRRDRHAITELVLYIDNDGQLYRSQTVPIMKNLARKIRKGVYDFRKSVKLWQYLVDAGARKYVKEFGTPGARVDTIFNAATRRHVAKQYAAKFLRMWRNGELSNM